MFSLTTLPVHCCSTVFTDVTSLTSTLVTLLAKKTYLAILLLVRKLATLRDGDTEALWSPLHTAVLQQDVLANSLDKQTIWNYLQYYCLLHLTLPWRWELWRNNVILSVRVLVKAVGVKPLKVMNTEITVFSVTPVVRQTRHKIPTDRNWKRTRYGAVTICIDPSTGLEV